MMSLVTLVAPVLLQLAAADVPIDPNVATADDNSPTGMSQVSLMNSREFWLSIFLLAFGCIVIAAQLFYLKRGGADGSPAVSPETVVRLTIVSMIIVGSLVLISSGYSSVQIGPVMGLFGTVAGYLIGKHDR